MAKIYITESELKHIIKKSINENSENEVIGLLAGAGMMYLNHKLKHGISGYGRKSDKKGKREHGNTNNSFGEPDLKGGYLQAYGKDVTKYPAGFDTPEMIQILNGHIVGKDDFNRHSSMKSYWESLDRGAYPDAAAKEKAFGKWLSNRDNYFRANI